MYILVKVVVVVDTLYNYALFVNLFYSYRPQYNNTLKNIQIIRIIFLKLLYISQLYEPKLSIIDALRSIIAARTEERQTQANSQ